MSTRWKRKSGRQAGKEGERRKEGKRKGGKREVAQTYHRPCEQAQCNHLAAPHTAGQSRVKKKEEKKPEHVHCEIACETPHTKTHTAGTSMPACGGFVCLSLPFV
eukprot:713351-Rhodomonas_salina.1